MPNGKRKREEVLVYVIRRRERVTFAASKKDTNRDENRSEGSRKGFVRGFCLVSMNSRFDVLKACENVIHGFEGEKDNLPKHNLLKSKRRFAVNDKHGKVRDEKARYKDHRKVDDNGVAQPLADKILAFS